MPSRLMEDSEEAWGEGREGNPFLRALFARSWFLVIPLIAIWWFEAKKIDPMAKQIDQKIAEDRKGPLRLSRGKLLAQSRQMGVRISLLRAVGDTFTVRFTQMGVLLDSLRILEAADRKEIAGLEAQSESLRGVFSEAEGKSRVNSERLTVLQATVDSLQGPDRPARGRDAGYWRGRSRATRISPIVFSAPMPTGKTTRC